ncbi:MAG: non-heme iron oxygenase ferredoxin subunit [Pirellulaceae bacterium]
MSDFVKVATVSSVPDPSRFTLEIGERVVVLFHVAGQFYCIDDVCTHDGGPLGDGTFEDHQVACPRHGARFDIRSGKALSMPATEPIAVHEVKIEGNDVFVRLSEGQ